MERSAFGEARASRGAFPAREWERGTTQEPHAVHSQPETGNEEPHRLRQELHAVHSQPETGNEERGDELGDWEREKMPNAQCPMPIPRSIIE